MIDDVLLPVSIDIPTTSYFSISLPISVIISTASALDWYYEKFVNIYTDATNNICFVGMSFDCLAKNSTLFDFKIEDVRNENIVERIKREVSINRNYAFIYLDEYYLSCKKDYRKNHFHHESLIFGYSDQKNVFYAIAFDRRGHFAKLEYSYFEVEKGYVEATKISPSNNIHSVIFFRCNDELIYKFNMCKFINSLTDYLNGNIPRNLEVIQYNWKEHIYRQDDSCIFGLNCIQKIISDLGMRSSRKIDFFDFRKIHFLYEHSKMLYERFDYIRKYISNDCKTLYDTLCENYKEIVKEYSVARILFMKTLSNSNCVYDKYSSFCELLNKIYNNEKNVIANIIQVLKSSNDCVKVKNEIDCCPRISSKLSYDKNKIVANFEPAVSIHGICIPQIADYKIYLNNNLIDSFWFKNNFSSETTYCKLGVSAKQLILVVDTVLGIPIDEVNIEFYGDNLFKNCEVRASSCWQLAEGKTDISVYNIFADDDLLYWRASEQKHAYEGNDWLQVYFDKNTTINSLIIGELKFSHRLKKYRITYFDDNDIEKTILVANYIEGEANKHMFSEIVAKSIKIYFEECVEDSFGYAEPIVNRFGAYYQA